MVSSNIIDNTIDTARYDIYYLLTKINESNIFGTLYHYINNNPNEIYKKNNNGETILFHIIKNIYYFKSDILKKLISLILLKLDDDKINEQNNDGKTALMFACDQITHKNGFDIINILLYYGADVNIRDNNGDTAISILTKYRDVKNPAVYKAFIMIREYGAD